MAVVNGTGTEVHGTPVEGHTHDWKYSTRDLFSITHKCKTCRATKIQHNADGEQPNIIIYERNSEYFGGKDKSVRRVA